MILKTESNPINDYGKILCLGDLDNILIYAISSKSKLPLGSPETEYLRNIYQGLKKTFNPYSEYLLMYYVYRLEGT